MKLLEFPPPLDSFDMFFYDLGVLVLVVVVSHEECHGDKDYESECHHHYRFGADVVEQFLDVKQRVVNH